MSQITQVKDTPGKGDSICGDWMDSRDVQKLNMVEVFLVEFLLGKGDNY